MRHPRILLASAVPALSLALLSSPAVAQALAPETPLDSDSTVPVVLTISGGISLGSYQSGVNWTLVEFFRHSYHNAAFRARYGGLLPHRVAVATGASAGNINALLSALQWCERYDTLSRRAEESLLWKTWTGIGLRELFPNDRAARQLPRPVPATDTGAAPGPQPSFAVFRRDSLRTLYDQIEARIDSAGHAACSVDLGITLTKLAPDSIELNPRIHPRAQRFASAFAVRSREDGNEMRLEIVAPNDSMRLDSAFGLMIVPPTRRDGTIAFESVRDLVEASSAFPVAFEPVRVRYYGRDVLRRNGGCPLGPAGECSPPDAAEFVDGGVFDNNPLGLALGMYHHAHRGSHAERYIYIDPDGVRPDTAPPAPGRSPPERDTRGLSAVGALLGGAVPAARQYELHALARMLQSSSRERISITDRRHPVVSSHLGAFAGFLGRPFRQYDFYVGMYDGLYFAAHDVVCQDSTGGFRGRDAERVRRRCAGAVLGTLLEEPALNLSPYAGTVLHHLYEEEFKLPRPVSALHPPRLVQMLEAIDTALHLARGDTVRCTGGAPLDRALCREGFTAFVHRLQQTRGVMDLTVDWDRHAGCSADTIDCFDDPDMNRLIKDPERYLARLASRVVDRMDNVERGLGHSGNHRGVALAGALFHLTSGEPRRGWEKDPSSVPDTRGTWWRLLSHALPYYIAVGTSVETGYRPSYYLGRGRGAAIIFPMTALHFSPTRDTTRKQVFAGYGAGLHMRAWGPVEVEGSYQILRPYADLAGRPVGTVEGGVMLADKIRLGLRYVVSDPGGQYPAARGLLKDGLSVTIGLLDLNGLIYWTGRLAAH